MPKLTNKRKAMKREPKIYRGTTNEKKLCGKKIIVLKEITKEPKKNNNKMSN